ncbi:MAG: transposase zinc-binding domain-containing protein [Planctomycetaceae bacterium]
MESWLTARSLGERPVATHVEGEFREYLRCGVLCFGFARARCSGCGRGFLVAFSCKGRGVCPSCTGRRMAQTAAHLADRVIRPRASPPASSCRARFMPGEVHAGRGSCRARFMPGEVHAGRGRRRVLASQARHAGRPPGAHRTRPHEARALVPANHPLRPAVTALTIGTLGKRGAATSSLPPGEGRGEGAPMPQAAPTRPRESRGPR